MWLQSNCRSFRFIRGIDRDSHNSCVVCIRNPHRLPQPHSIKVFHKQTGGVPATCTHWNSGGLSLYILYILSFGAKWSQEKANNYIISRSFVVRRERGRDPYHWWRILAWCERVQNHTFSSAREVWGRSPLALNLCYRNADWTVLYIQNMGLHLQIANSINFLPFPWYTNVVVSDVFARHLSLPLTNSRVHENPVGGPLSADWYSWLRGLPKICSLSFFIFINDRGSRVIYVVMLVQCSVSPSYLSHYTDPVSLWWVS